MARRISYINTIFWPLSGAAGNTGKYKAAGDRESGNFGCGPPHSIIRYSFFAIDRFPRSPSPAGNEVSERFGGNNIGEEGATAGTHLAPVDVDA